MKPTTVYLHIGAGKTGTSAIQVALARNREALARHDIIYPDSRADRFAPKGQITSGNSEVLHAILWPTEGNPEANERSRIKLQSILEMHRGRSILFSSEKLVTASEERFRELYRFLKERECEIRIIYYVRHLMDCALSLYNQGIKGGGLHRDFNRFAKTFRIDYAEKIQAFSTIVGKGNFILHLYDSDKHNLFGGFLGLLTPVLNDDALSNFDMTKARDTVNRSLSPTELEVMKMINLMLKKKGMENTKPVAKTITRWLLHSRPLGRVQHRVTHQQMASLEQRNSDVLRYVNEFASGKFVLKLKSDDIVVCENTSVEESSDIARDAISLLLDFITDTVDRRRPKQPEPASPTE